RASRVGVPGAREIGLPDGARLDRLQDLDRAWRGTLLRSHLHDAAMLALRFDEQDRKSTRLNSSHVSISYAVFCLKKKNTKDKTLFYIYLLLTINFISLNYSTIHYNY